VVKKRRHLPGWLSASSSELSSGTKSAPNENGASADALNTLMTEASTSENLFTSVEGSFSVSFSSLFTLAGCCLKVKQLHSIEILHLIHMSVNL